MMPTYHAYGADWIDEALASTCDLLSAIRRREDAQTFLWSEDREKEIDHLCRIIERREATAEGVGR